MNKTSDELKLTGIGIWTRELTLIGTTIGFYNETVPYLSPVSITLPLAKFASSVTALLPGGCAGFTAPETDLP